MTGMFADQFFPASYQSSRDRLLASARAWSGRMPVLIDSRAIAARGPSGETLALDWVQIGPRIPVKKGRGARTARRTLVLSSGTHGIEGFCGAGVQHALMSLGLQATPPQHGSRWAGLPAPADWPDDFAVVVLHAINPYGFSWLRRVNENNVDLNRNSLAEFDRSRIHPDYEKLFGQINPSDLDPQSEQRRWDELGAFIAERGERAFQQAVAEGQYKYPEGMQFGGQAPQASTVHLQSLCREHLAGAGQVLWVDYHTGLGESGHCELITGLPKTSPEFELGRSVWGEAVKSTESGDSLSTRLNGLSDQGLKSCVDPGTRFFFVSAEYGTYPIMRILSAMRMDNWLHHHAGPEHPMWPAIKAEMLEAYRPNQAAWREKVLLAAEQHLSAALRALGI